MTKIENVILENENYHQLMSLVMNNVQIVVGMIYVVVLVYDQ